MTDSSTTIFETFSRVGNSYMELSNTLSRMVRRPRAPVLRAIARRAMARKTGARGLRTVLESVLLNSMYELPSLENVSKVVVDETVIDGDAEPLILYENTQHPPMAASE